MNALHVLYKRDTQVCQNYFYFIFFLTALAYIYMQTCDCKCEQIQGFFHYELYKLKLARLMAESVFVCFMSSTFKTSLEQGECALTAF